jgi:hypothetical protein
MDEDLTQPSDTLLFTRCPNECKRKGRTAIEGARCCCEGGNQEIGDGVWNDTGLVHQRGECHHHSLLKVPVDSHNARGAFKDPVNDSKAFNVKNVETNIVSPYARDGGNLKGIG